MSLTSTTGNGDKGIGGELGRKGELLEVSVFLLLIPPSMMLSFFVVKQGILGFTLTALATIFRHVGLLSLILFSLGHGNEGTAGVITVGFMGLIFALIYLWRQSLAAPIVMHFLQDFIGTVLVPLLG